MCGTRSERAAGERAERLMRGEGASVIRNPLNQGRDPTEGPTGKVCQKPFRRVASV